MAFKRYFEHVTQSSEPAQPNENLTPGLTVIVRGFDNGTKQASVKSLISAYQGLGKWEMKSADEAATDAAQHLVATFDTLENAQSFAYKLRNKSWSGLKLRSEVVGSADNRNGLKEELKKLVEKKRANEKQRLSGGNRGQKETSKSGRVIVRNLPFSVNEAQLNKLFKSAGEVLDVQLPSMADGRKRGFAFVQFSSRQSALNAVSKFQALSIKGRPIAVDLSVPKEVHVKLTKESGTYSAAGVSGAQDEPDESPSKGEGNRRQLKLGDDQYIGFDEDGEEGNEYDDDDANEEERYDDYGEDNDDEDHVSNIDENDVDFSDADQEEDNDDYGSEDDDDEEEEDEPERKRQRRNPKPSDVNEGKTLFIKSLPFNVEDPDLSEFFSRFGEVSMAKVVLDKETEESKGCGFIKFKDVESVSKCLERINSPLGLVMERRKLSAEVAVSREEAEKRKQEGTRKSQLANLVNDKRNLHLARVGLIRGAAVGKMSKHDLKLRDSIEKLKKQKLRNSNIVVSSTRLCIHNLPRKWTQPQLRAVCLEAAGGKDNGAVVTECRIMKAKTDKSASGFGTSLGFAFVAFSTHQHALKALYHLNDNPTVFSDQKRPVVEFSMENMLALQKKERRLLKAKMNQPKGHQTEDTEAENAPKKKKKKASKNSIVSSEVDPQTLNYKSKKKMKKFARTPLFKSSNEVSMENSEQFDLPQPVISNMTAKELKQRLKNPMPKKTVSTSIDPKTLKSSLKKRKRDLVAKRARENKQFSLAEKRANQSRRKKTGKYLNEPMRDDLDTLIEKRMAKRGN